MTIIRNGEVAVVCVDGIYLMAEVEIHDDSPRGIVIGSIYGNSIMIDEVDWRAFKNLIDEVDEALRLYPLS